MSVVKKHLFVCTAQKPQGIPDCSEKGGGDLLTAFKAAIYRANLEKDVLISGCGCIGVCNYGPNVVVYPEGVWYTGVKMEEVQKIVDEHLVNGRKLDRATLDESMIQAEQQSWHMKIRMKMKTEGQL